MRKKPKWAWDRSDYMLQDIKVRLIVGVVVVVIIAVLKLLGVIGI
jgi:hypothetical protein